MQRCERLDLVLRVLFDAGTGVDGASDTVDDSGAFNRALTGLMCVLTGDVKNAHRAVSDALRTASDDDSHVLACAVAGLVIASSPEAGRDPRLRGIGGGATALTDARDVLAKRFSRPSVSQDDTDLGTVLAALTAEAALACAQLNLANEVFTHVAAVPVDLFGDRQHPFLTFMRSLGARIHALRGHIAEARVYADAAVASAVTPLEQLCAVACSALVQGHADERPATRVLVARIAAAPIETLTRSCYVLAAYGAASLGDHDQAGSLLLIAGGDADLGYLRIVDRAFAYEILVAGAAGADDLDLAQSWLVRARLLADNPISAATVARVESRVALLRKDPDAAERAAKIAAAWADADGREAESVAAKVLLARAQIVRSERGEAARDLADLVSQSQKLGHRSVRRWAARELRPIGRRLPPMSDGWGGLSAREREVAVLLARGRSNAQIAKELFLSQHTVRMHVSRVLQAFAVSSRAGVAVALTRADDSSRDGVLVDDASAPTAALTARQLDVATLVTDELSNKQIAEQLGVGVSTIEKHVAAIMRRWGVDSRVGIARTMGTCGDGNPTQASSEQGAL
ncbi:response regulator transcription factor (plasmid) [Coraliomargarita sp. W4R53]